MAGNLLWNQGTPYTGTKANNPPNWTFQDRPPTDYDVQNFALGDLWLDKSATPNPEPWVLVSKQGTSSSAGELATWVMFSGGSAGAIISLTSNSGGPVFADPMQNINTVGDGTSIVGVGVPASNTITFSVVGGRAASEFPTDSGTATPALGVLNILAQNATLGAGSSVLFSAPGPSNTVQLNVTDANDNTIIGADAGILTLSGSRSTVLGQGAYAAATSGIENVLVGQLSGAAITSGGNNVFVGKSSGLSLLTGSFNTGIGNLSGNALTGSEANNTLLGRSSTGIAGVSGLIQVVVGDPSDVGRGGTIMHNYPASTATNGANVFIGLSAGNFTISSTSATANNVLGQSSLTALTTGHANNSLGSVSLSAVTTGFANTTIGHSAGYDDVGLDGITTGTFNTLLGYAAGQSLRSTDSSNIFINAIGTAGDNNTLRIGQGNGSSSQFLAKSYIQGIAGVTTDNAAVPVLIAVNGQLGVTSSSQRYKTQIKDLGSESEILYHLKPKSFEMRSHPGIPDWGLIAEDVDEVFPQICVYKDGQPETVQYQKLVPLMLNEIQRLNNRLKLLENKIV